MKDVPDSYKRSSLRRIEESWGHLGRMIDDLPTLDFKWENFENVGTIFSTLGATCLKCGSNEEVYADVSIIEDPENSDDRIVASEHFCKKCNKRFGWGFKVTRNDIAG